MELEGICVTCDELRTVRSDGECFRCHCKGISVNWVGGGSYGRKAFHDHTIGEVVRDAKHNAALQGRTIIPKTTVYTGR